VRVAASLKGRRCDCDVRRRATAATTSIGIGSPVGVVQGWSTGTGSPMGVDTRSFGWSTGIGSPVGVDASLKDMNLTRSGSVENRPRFGCDSRARIARTGSAVQRQLRVQLGRPQLNEAASGSKAEPAEPCGIGMAIYRSHSVVSISSRSLPR
jgi:hypothetical protein